jgi:2',3'-cyclic-nucleotide 2'-phosphodiesterase
LTLAFIGDIIGRPGRELITRHLRTFREEYGIDFVVANYENASHGFGLTPKTAKELVDAGIDTMTGGNHTWDKKEIHGMFDSFEILRPHNYPEVVPGTGCKVYDVNGERLGVLNLMGHYGMPYTDNAFRCAKETVTALRADGVGTIFVDFHAEASSEKRGLMMMLQGEVSGIIGTHTHVGSDDFQISHGTAYLSDIGLTGCRDNVIGMDAKVPVERFLTGMPGRFEVPKKCKAILQMAVMRFDAGNCIEAFKIKQFDDGRRIISEAWHEDD